MNWLNDDRRIILKLNNLEIRHQLFFSEIPKNHLGGQILYIIRDQRKDGFLVFFFTFWKAVSNKRRL